MFIRDGQELLCSSGMGLMGAGALCGGRGPTIRANCTHGHEVGFGWVLMC